MPPTGYQGPMYNEPRYHPRDGREMDGRKGSEKSDPFNLGLKRRMEVWDFENHLAEVHTLTFA